MALLDRYFLETIRQHIRENAKGWLWCVALLLPALLLIGLWLHFGSEDEGWRDPASARVLLLTSVPEGYVYAEGNPSSHWEYNVTFADGKVVDAQSNFMLTAGDKVCVARTSRSALADDYVVIGLIDVMRRAGKACALNEPGGGGG